MISQSIVSWSVVSLPTFFLKKTGFIYEPDYLDNSDCK